MPKQRVNLCVNDDVWAQFKELAQRRHVSASAAAEEAMARTLADEEGARQRRLAAWESIMNLDLGPMPDPETLCREIEEMYEAPEGLEL
ncbi:MAG: hypothetical protein KKI08_26695 [Armatimonadetes bacterium]|nr:hypothetical protein [Armatimonadota bacterium]